MCHMSKMIQVRNVSNRLHDELVRRAKARNLSLTAYVEEILEREMARPPREEVFDRIARRDPIVRIDPQPRSSRRSGRSENGTCARC